MTVDQLTTIVALIGSIGTATAWLHGSLSRIGADVRVLSSKVDAFTHRLERLEREVDDIRKKVNT